MNLPEVRLIQLPIETACAVKWQSGRQKYGPIFRTNPLEELYAELIDSLNYVSQAETDLKMSRIEASVWRKILTCLAVRVKARWEASC